jgi:6-phosphogluconolactonase
MTDRRSAAVEILADAEALAAHASQWLLSMVTAAQGPFAVALSGGSTPQHMYESWTRPPYRDKFPWDRMHWFFGDERFVPHDDAASNYRMVHRAFLSRVPIPETNIHPIPTEGLSPEEAAASYERELKSFYGADRLDASRPLFALTFLGLGGDGHTASLFPGIAALDERARWVAAVRGPKRDARITLTYPALNSSRQAAFLVTGEEKRDILKRLRAGDQSLPAAHVRPVGDLHIFTDNAAGESKS